MVAHNDSQELLTFLLSRTATAEVVSLLWASMDSQISFVVKKDVSKWHLALVAASLMRYLLTSSFSSTLNLKLSVLNFNEPNGAAS